MNGLADVRREIAGQQGFLLRLDGRGLDGPAWVREHRTDLRAALRVHGAVFFHGFADTSEGFAELVDVLAGDPVSYVGGVTPRSPVHGNVYTATDAPPPLPIVQHHELSYHRHTPRLLAFYCDVPSPKGGRTPLTDARQVWRRLYAEAPEILDRLRAQGTLFVRNYNEANFKSWQETWGTDDRDALEALLRDRGVSWRWMSDSWLQTRQRLPAVCEAAGDPVLFSCIHLWHRWFVTKMVEATGLQVPDDEAKYPYATFFGDGEPIPDDFVARMHDAYEALAVAVPYAAGDFALVHNLLTTHGREPYEPPRSVHVTMREHVYLQSDAAFVQPAPGADHA
jgi:alpha-ketoglutarate-dependent taurine dioxygenase